VLRGDFVNDIDYQPFIMDLFRGWSGSDHFASPTRLFKAEGRACRKRGPDRELVVRVSTALYFPTLWLIKSNVCFVPPHTQVHVVGIHNTCASNPASFPNWAQFSCSAM
jgi:hypothetical protein